jgi:hypothetical protein
MKDIILLGDMAVNWRMAAIQYANSILLGDMAVNWRMAAIQYANSARDLFASVDCRSVV